MFKTTHPNINISVLCISFRGENSQTLTTLTGFLNICLKICFFSSKILEKKNCQNPFPAILRQKKKEKKFFFPISREGVGTKGLSGL